MPSVAVLGLGNTLMRDDGVGARVLDELARRYRFLPTVILIKSDAPMARLAAELEGVGHLVVVDAVRSGHAPGTVHCLGRSGAEAITSQRFTRSSHGMGLAEFFALLSALGRCPEIRIIGVEAGELNEAGLELSEPVEAALPRVTAAVAEELRRWGTKVQEREGLPHHA
jgi:hydrogenase maturation protease